MKKNILLIISVMALFIFSCDLGTVDIMNIEEYAAEVGLEVKDVGFSLSSNNDQYFGIRMFDVYIYFDDDIDLSYLQEDDLEESITNNIELENATLYDVECDEIYNSEDSSYQSYITMTIQPTDSVGDIEVTIPAKTLSLTYNKDVYYDCYNKEAETLEISPDFLSSYYEDGLYISKVISISTHEYLVIDTYNDQILLIDSNAVSVTGECSTYLNSIADIKYNESENKLYMVGYNNSSLYILDIDSMSCTAKSFTSGSDEGNEIDLDVNRRRIYILSDEDDLFSLDMDDYSTKIYDFHLPSPDHFVVDGAHDMIYAARYSNTYCYSLSGDTPTQESSNSSSQQYHNGFVLNGDGSKIYYNDYYEVYVIDTSDLSETSLGGGGVVFDVLSDYDLLVTYKSLYDSSINDYSTNIYKYNASDYSLISQTDLGSIDSFTVNTDGTEALVYTYSSSLGASVIDFVTLGD